MRIDDGERLVEHDDVDVGAHQAAAERDLLLAVGGEARGAVRCSVGVSSSKAAICAPGRRRRPPRRRDCAAERPDCRRPSSCRRSPGTGTPARCCARSGGRSVTSLPSNRTRPCGRPQQPRDDVEERGLAAARRAEQRIGAAVLPFDVERLQRPVGLRRRAARGSCGGDCVERDRRHRSAALSRRSSVCRTDRRTGRGRHRHRTSRARRPRYGCTPCDCETQVSASKLEMHDALRARDLRHQHPALDRHGAVRSACGST